MNSPKRALSSTGVTVQLGNTTPPNRRRVYLLVFRVSGPYAFWVWTILVANNSLDFFWPFSLEKGERQTKKLCCLKNYKPLKWGCFFVSFAVQSPRHGISLRLAGGVVAVGEALAPLVRAAALRLSKRLESAFGARLPSGTNPFDFFGGKYSPLNSTDQKGMPFFPHGNPLGMGVSSLGFSGRYSTAIGLDL